MKLYELFYEEGGTSIEGKVDVYFWHGHTEYYLIDGKEFDGGDGMSRSDFKHIKNFDEWFDTAEVGYMFAIDNTLRIELNMEELDYTGNDFDTYVKENF